uniref:uncharacterized protein LOC118144509 n=1 Tax=Callithrix jacchus TaxID=9483 RepID=UPI00159E8ACD|nr:uncharacterized protein LOC118144509 [Callithrix jacchus]
MQLCVLRLGYMSDCAGLNTGFELGYGKNPMRVPQDYRGRDGGERNLLQPGSTLRGGPSSSYWRETLDLSLEPPSQERHNFPRFWRRRSYTPIPPRWKSERYGRPTVIAGGERDEAPRKVGGQAGARFRGAEPSQPRAPSRGRLPVPKTPPLSAARSCDLAAESGTEEGVKLSLGRCNDPQGLACPGPGCPREGSERCQGLRHYRRRAARSLAWLGRVWGPCKVGAGRVRRPSGPEPRPWGRPLGGKRGRSNQVGTRSKARAFREHQGLRRERGALGTETGRGTPKSGTHLPPSRAAPRLPLHAAHPPARLLLFLLLLPGARGCHAPGSESSESAAPRGWKGPVAPTGLRPCQEEQTHSGFELCREEAKRKTSPLCH